MKYTKNDLYEGMKLRCVSTIEPHWWNVGKQYEVEKRTDGLFILKDETGYIWNSWLILDFLNGKSHCKMELVEEEKEMKKYAKITKYAGLIDTDKENGLEIGKEYEIVRFSGVSEDCWVYLNDKRPEYFISETQYELVEKEEVPTLKANVDLKSVIQAKLDELTTEAERLFKKRDRLEQQAINLNKKAQKLKEVIETIKEFE
ncbi:hypothetical protein EfaCPT1_gp55 [Enterococcus phage EfaCPT1]|uniref:Uncharacterized protein n=1 Tax=Enterococcus phage EfaCPT1 TaxID=1204540 RepID=I7B7F4_9CAUD|nr:hypothetical protein EfaCPT1_gp55 [Enterococcus phage EfaCPT1]AFO10852.1 hypothetical protein EfaCPT1_gp55 [Enterococcus phage EfaCPT1]